MIKTQPVTREFLTFKMSDHDVKNLNEVILFEKRRSPERFEYALERGGLKDLIVSNLLAREADRIVAAKKYDEA